MGTIDGNSGLSLRGLFETNTRLHEGLRKLASLHRIDRAADDAAGLGIATRMQAMESGFNVGVRNIHDAISAAQTAEGGLSSTADNLSRMRELAVQARNGTLSDGDRAALQAEYDQLAQEVDRTSQSTRFNGKQLLDGSLQGQGELTVFDGLEATSFGVAAQSAQALGVAGLDLRDDAALKPIDGAIDRVSSSRAGLGAETNTLGRRVEQLQNARENVAAARSRIEDLDVARGVASVTRDRILAQGQVALAGQGRVAEEAVLDLMGS